MLNSGLAAVGTADSLSATKKESFPATARIDYRSFRRLGPLVHAKTPSSAAGFAGSRMPPLPGAPACTEAPPRLLDRLAQHRCLQVDRAEVLLSWIRQEHGATVAGDLGNATLLRVERRLCLHNRGSA